VRARPPVSAPSTPWRETTIFAFLALSDLERPLAPAGPSMEQLRACVEVVREAWRSLLPRQRRVRQKRLRGTRRPRLLRRCPAESFGTTTSPRPRRRRRTWASFPTILPFRRTMRTPPLLPQGSSPKLALNRCLIFSATSIAFHETPLRDQQKPQGG
jgi:hypothetical protein